MAGTRGASAAKAAALAAAEADAAAAEAAAEVARLPQSSAGGGGGKRKGPGPPLRIADVLKERFLGIYRVPLHRVQQALTVRQLNTKNVRMLMDSIRDDGLWEDRGAISVYFREVSKKPEDFSQVDADEAGLAIAYDGNHQLQAMTNIVAEDAEQEVIPKDGILCYYYLEITDPQLKRVVSDGELGGLPT